MSVKWPVAGASFVGAFAVISYVYSTPDPDAGQVIGLIAVMAVVIIGVLIVARYARQMSARP